MRFMLKQTPIRTNPTNPRIIRTATIGILLSLTLAVQALFQSRTHLGEEGIRQAGPLGKRSTGVGSPALCPGMLALVMPELGRHCPNWGSRRRDSYPFSGQSSTTLALASNLLIHGL